MKFLLFIFVLVKADYDLEYDPQEVMIAQESRHYETIVKPPVRIIKPRGVTNSHRPQYNLDSVEVDDKDSEGMVREAVLRALEKKNHMGNFAQVLPIIRAMSGNQRVALASLVASQVTAPGRQVLNLPQVRSLVGNENSTAELILPILLDTANLIQRSLHSKKKTRDTRYLSGITKFISYPFDIQQQDIPDKQHHIDRFSNQPHFQRRSYQEDLSDDELNIGVQNADTLDRVTKSDKIRLPPRVLMKQNNTDVLKTIQNITQAHDTKSNDMEDNRNSSRKLTEATDRLKFEPAKIQENGTFDLMTDATNQSIAQDLPVAEKLRSLNRYLDRKGNLIRRGTYPPKLTTIRRGNAEPTVSPITRRRPLPARKLPATNEHAQCELFTNNLCLHSEDYPTDAILSSLRRNKAAGALLADIKEPGEGAVDGITAAQEAKYTADHYLISNRRGDTANRDFASAGEAGFMCPSTVKYARPQRARATSGQWKYIVNTGEHTQTLRLEKCLKPKEPCTYLTDNFKSKCVQVYNYHRLLTWDQQNGLHMDIFKVPTCCSCHIEGYSVSFPPVGQRVHETSSEHFPGEDLSSEQGNRAFEDVQSSIQRPVLNKSPSFEFNRPIDSFPPFADNSVQASAFPNAKLNNDFDSIKGSGPTDSYGNSYFPDNFHQASTIRNIKRPVPRNPAGIANPSNNIGSDSATLPSFLEPPTPSAPASFSFSKDSKYKLSDHFQKSPRPNRRPIRKKISRVPDDLMSSGTSAIGAFQIDNFETLEDLNDEVDESQVNKVINHAITRPTIAPKLPAAKENIYITREHSNDENGKKINYNYHPIIDFFEEEEKDSDSIDREDNLDSYVQSSESEWKPISHTPVDRRKH
ncbi:neurotrophin 1 isoform X1 [Pieris brassicae]|uniref:neurotrophin 1 isoform X1 n=1 Tax=Pieris brassicae TaxID=7116 RepID=UPI001E65E630|nr:neurotrophin 1 isoform X1 [Pieris brassicae]